MTPEQSAEFLSLARLLCRPGPLQKLVREVTEQLVKVVPVDVIRYDLSDAKGAMWSRVCSPGEEPDRPGLGIILRLKTREVFERDGDEVRIPLGFGDRATGRIVARKKGGFSDKEVEALKHCADLFTLAFRARPFEAKPKPRSPFDDMPELV